MNKAALAETTKRAAFPSPLTASSLTNRAALLTQTGDGDAVYKRMGQAVMNVALKQRYYHESLGIFGRKKQQAQPEQPLARVIEQNNSIYEDICAYAIVAHRPNRC